MTRAKFPGSCPVCLHRIDVGMVVRCRAGRWVHQLCADQTVTPATARCGATNATDGRPCRNPVVPGDLCSLHRWDGRMA